jgi:prevent-host-death family protein
MALRTIGFSEAKARLSEITEDVNRTGKPIVVYKHNRPWVNITPAVEAVSPGTRHAAFGVLRKYADPSKAALEDGAWEADVKEHYANR